MGKKEVISNLKINTDNFRKIYYKNYKKNNGILCFSLVLTMTLNNIGNIVLNSLKEEKNFENPSQVYECIEKNPYLDDDEKEIIYYIDGFVDDYYYLLDYEVIKDRLQSFDIDYKSNYETEGIRGSWKPNINVMNFSYCNSSSEIKKNPSIASHESYHLLSVKYKEEYSECLSEGITSLLNYEYSDFNNKDYYIKERQIVRALALLIGNEKLIESYCKYDINILKNELKKISTNKEVLENLFKNMEEYHKLNIESYKYLERTLDEDEYKKYKQIDDKKKKLILDISANLNHYALSKKLKTNSDFYKNLNMLASENDNYMENNEKHFVYLNEQDIEMYTINKEKIKKLNNIR